MAKRIIMPKQGLQMEAGVITQWLHGEGDEIQEGEPLFEMETDKLAITIDSTASGTILKILAEEGDDVPVAQTIAIVGEPGEDYAALLEGGDEPETAPEPAPQAAPAAVEEAPAAAAPERVFATPRAKMHAEERGVSLAGVAGSGPDGLIVDRDVPAAPKAAPRIVPTGEDVSIPLSGMRRIIAQRMHDSLSNLAQANHRMEVDMTEAVHMREQLKALGVKVSYNDLVLRCVAKALTEFPDMNASMTDAAIIRRGNVNVGMAVAVDSGLLVPVIRNADRLTLPEIGEVARDLGQRAKAGGLSPDELSGGTFTVTNLGMFGVDSFTPIINAPEAGILGVGQIKKKAVVLDDDSIAVRPMMWLSLTYDHRVVDGAPAAQFLKRVRELLEHPALLI